MKLTFLGATETVTGSKYLVSFNDKKHILVDCGLFQGYKALRLRNWEALPFDPSRLEAVILTHAHIDHTGYLPLLVKNGFKGVIYSSAGTRALCQILLLDSAHLQEEEAYYANKHGYSKHHPSLPLYTQGDAEKALALFKSVPYESPVSLGQEATFELRRSGHIIGSSFVKIQHQGISLVFSGDLGRLHDPIMRTPTPMEQADYLVLESTYGDRLHEKEHPMRLLKRVVNETLKRGGSLIIPAFAVGRAQMILYYLFQLRKSHEIPEVPMFLDSPMAINSTDILCKHAEDHRLSVEECAALSQAVTFTSDAEASMALDKNTDSKIIISASGMATGGRILFHLQTYAPDERNTILFTGYQAGGTRGARLVNGEKEIKIHGQMVPVHARIETLSNLSAHADYEEILTWLRHFKVPPKKTFITHGEPASAAALQDKIETELGWTCNVPHYKQTEALR